MEPTPAVHVALLPLDSEIFRTRLELEDFRLGPTPDDQIVSMHFGAEFPGDALVLYPSFLTAAGNDGVVDGTRVSRPTRATVK